MSEPTIYMFRQGGKETFFNDPKALIGDPPFIAFNLASAKLIAMEYGPGVVILKCNPDGTVEEIPT